MEIDKKIILIVSFRQFFFTNRVLRNWLSTFTFAESITKPNFSVFTIFHHVTVISTVFIRPYLFRYIERMEYFSGNL